MLETIERFLDINLTQTQFFICCVSFMFFCLAFITYIFIKFLLNVISQANARNRQKKDNGVEEER